VETSLSKQNQARPVLPFLTTSQFFYCIHWSIPFEKRNVSKALNSEFKTLN